MSDGQPTIFQRIETIVRNTVAFDGPIGADSTFEDLGFDSLDAVELTIAVEDEFGIEINMDEGEYLTTIGAFVTLVGGKVRR